MFARVDKPLFSTYNTRGLGRGTGFSGRNKHMYDDSARVSAGDSAAFGIEGTCQPRHREYS